MARVLFPLGVTFFSKFYNPNLHNIARSDRIGFKMKNPNASQVCGRDGTTAILAAMRSAGVAIEVNLREHVTCMPPPSANKAAHPGFETQRRCHQKSKTGVSVAQQKGFMSSKIFLKKRKNENLNGCLISTCFWNNKNSHNI